MRTRRAFILGGRIVASALALVFALARQSPAQKGAPVTFVEVPAKSSGITWTHDAARSELRHAPETVGAGCAFLDYDNDGWLDIYLVNGGASDFFTPKTPLKNALYKNNRDGTFTDVTDRAGVAAGGTFGMGAAAGDFDAD